MGVRNFLYLSIGSLIAGTVVLVGPYQNWFSFGPYHNHSVLGGTLLLTVFACSLLAAYVHAKRNKIPSMKGVKSIKKSAPLASSKTKKKSSKPKLSKKKPAGKKSSKKKAKKQRKSAKRKSRSSKRKRK